MKNKKEEPPLENEKDRSSHKHLFLPHKYVNRKLSYILLVIGIAFLLLALYFTVKSVLTFMHPPRPLVREQNAVIVESWMTIPYIAKAYRIPEQELFQRTGLPKNTGKSQSIKSIAEKNKLNPDEMTAQIRQAIITFQKDHPRPSRKPLP